MPFVKLNGQNLVQSEGTLDIGSVHQVWRKSQSPMMSETILISFLILTPGSTCVRASYLGCTPVSCMTRKPSWSSKQIQNTTQEALRFNPQIQPAAGPKSDLPPPYIHQPQATQAATTAFAACSVAKATAPRFCDVRKA